MKVIAFITDDIDLMSFGAWIPVSTRLPSGKMADTGKRYKVCLPDKLYPEGKAVTVVEINKSDIIEDNGYLIVHRGLPLCKFGRTDFDFSKSLKDPKFALWYALTIDKCWKKDTYESVKGTEYEDEYKSKLKKGKVEKK